MVLSRTLAGAVMLLAISAARADDIAPLLANLNNAATHEQALGQLDKIPFSALQAVVNAAFDDATPTSVRNDISAHLEGIYARLRTERHEQEAATAHAWLKNSLEDAYRASPHVNAKWDEKALAALDHIGQYEEGFDLLDEAMKAGCNNTLIEALYQIRGLQLRRLDAAKAATALDTAVKNFDNSKFPDGTKFFVRMQLVSLMASFSWPADFKSKLKLPDEMEKTFALFDKYVQQQPGQKALADTAYAMWTVANEVLPDRKAAFDKMMTTITAPLGRNSILNRMTAWFEMNQGNAVRDPSGMATRESNIHWDRAAAAAIEGWAIDPLDYMCTHEAMQAYDERCNRETMEMLFRMTILANPGDSDAYVLKGGWLLNRESVQAGLDWGHECLRTGTPRSRIPVVLRELRLAVAYNRADPDAYMQQPAVWTDLQAVYEKTLSDVSRAVDDRAQYLLDRSKYMIYAVQCHQWQAFLTLSQQFGDDVDMKYLGGKDLYAYTQRDAKSKLAAEGKTPAAPAALIPIPPAERAVASATPVIPGVVPPRAAKKAKPAAAPANDPTIDSGLP